MAEGSQAVGHAPKVYGTHGAIRGLSNDSKTTATPSWPEYARFEGLFGKMFRELPESRFSGRLLGDLADAMTSSTGKTPPEGEPNDSENTGTEDDPGISAGYTYLAQFIDHDISFDPASSFQKKKDPDALIDYRTPRFDLDNLYGRGPADQPYLYQRDGKSFILGDALGGNDEDKGACDLPRNDERYGRRAIIGDPRNDENEILSQLHAAMLRFHNLMVKKHHDLTFDQIQQMVRWHYQWIVLHDFLPTIVNGKTLGSILPHIEKGTTIDEDRPRLTIFNPRRWGKAVFMPVEFSVGAYRFGHSMIRPSYRLNKNADRIPLRDLFGFRPLQEGRAIDWSLFFPAKRQPPNGKNGLQWAYKIDTALVHPLGEVPERVLPEEPKSLREQSLAWRDLVRGVQTSLPSGQAVAEAMGENPIPDDELMIGPATEASARNNRPLVRFSRTFARDFKNNAPLWFYILAEAQRVFKNNRTPIRLGPVGGRIVAEVIVGLMDADTDSVLHQKGFVPGFPAGKGFSMWDLLEHVRQNGSH